MCNGSDSDLPNTLATLRGLKRAVKRTSKNDLGADILFRVEAVQDHLRFEKINTAPMGAQHFGFKSEMPAAKERVRTDPFFGRRRLGFETKMLCPRQGAYFFFQITDGPGPSQPGKRCPL